jgi:dihydrolipoamide dehydrogenase
MPRSAARFTWSRRWTAFSPGADPDLARPVVANAKKMFKEIRLKAGHQNGHRRQADQSGDGIQRPEISELYDRVLVAVGRVPNSADLGLENTKVELDEKGFVKVNDAAADDDPAIYAIGDIAGGILLAHKAHKEARIAVEKSSTAKTAFLTASFPAVVFTDPELAWCGLTEAEAKEKGVNTKWPNSRGRLPAAPCPLTARTA